MPVTYARPSVRTWKESVLFDRDAATRLPACEHFMGFNGTSLAQLLAARRGGARSVSLIAANPHFSELSRQHARAFSQYPVDRSYAGRLVARNLREYALADVIYVASSYVWDTFVREGTPEERLRLFPLTPAPRFVPGPAAEPHDTFNVVFVGALTADKGVPLLVDAFGRLTHPDMRLVLVGGWKTNAMKRYLQRARAADPRIELHVGDPLPHLHAAGVYAHPAYAEGFGYAAAEALACGVPLLVRPRG
jgi:glycosyltransferase involved in cell wall biosynthesis